MDIEEARVLVSIIIPVYNGAAYLHNAIDSCIRQSYKNIEIIIVNDGSSDDSISIIQKYAKIDSRIKYLDKLNGGQSSARNHGLRASIGKYVLFLDCDDSLQNNAVERLVNECIRHDGLCFCLFGFSIYFHDKILRTPNPGNAIFYLSDGYSNFENIDKLLNSPCNKFYSKDFIIEQFDESMVYGEDLLFNLMNLRYMKTNEFILCIPDCLYNVQIGNHTSINKKYAKGRISNSIKSETYKLIVYDQLFHGEFDKVTLYKTICYSIQLSFELCSAHFSFKQFIEEINDLCDMNFLRKCCYFSKNNFNFFNLRGGGSAKAFSIYLYST